MRTENSGTKSTEIVQAQETSSKYFSLAPRQSNRDMSIGTQLQQQKIGDDAHDIIQISSVRLLPAHMPCYSAQRTVER